MKLKNPTTSTWIASISLLFSVLTGLAQIKSFYEAQENLRIIVRRDLSTKYSLVELPVLNGPTIKEISSDWFIYILSTSAQVNTVVTDLKVFVGQTNGSGSILDNSNLPKSGSNQFLDDDGKNIQFPFQVAPGSVKRIRVKGAIFSLTDKEIKGSAQAQPELDVPNMPDTVKEVLKKFFVDPFGLKGVYDNHVMHLDSKQDDIIEPCVSVAILTGRNEVKSGSGYWYDAIQYRPQSASGELQPWQTLTPSKACPILSF